MIIILFLITLLKMSNNNGIFDHNEHIIEMFDRYISSIKPEITNMWIYNENKCDTDPEFVFKKISYEILVGVWDHKK